MKYFATLMLLALVGLVASEKYTTKYDNIDLDEILKSDRLLQNYVKCVLERGPCTPDGTELKKNLPDGLQNDCAKCSEKQRDGTIKVIKFLGKNKPDIFDELVKKYDPQGTYRAKHKEELEKEGIKV